MLQTMGAVTVTGVAATAGPVRERLMQVQRARRACLREAQSRSVTAWGATSDVAAAHASAVAAWERVLMLSEAEIDALNGILDDPAPGDVRALLVVELGEARERVLLADHAVELHSAGL